MKDVILWAEWTQAFFALRTAFSRQTTYSWAMIICAGMLVRDDILGVSSIIRALGLAPKYYHSILRTFHSQAVNLDKLLELWIQLCMRIFQPMHINGFVILIADGIKVGKEGKKMPAVRSLHQESSSNAKAEFIMGHYIQAISLAVISPLKKISAVPLVAQIHDGIVKSNRCKKTAIDKLAALLNQVSALANHPVMVVADAYYAAKTMITPLVACGNHLITRVQHNAVAYIPAKRPPPGKKGRPAKYGAKIVLKDLFKIFDVVADQGDECRYYCIDLVWRPVKTLVRFVLVEHETKGRYILLTTKLDLVPTLVIKLYRARWLIETGFKHALRIIGTYAYHFWMKAMDPIKRGSKNQYLHRCSKIYRDQVANKLNVFHVHIMFGCIAQGLAIHLAVNFRQQVWDSFTGWYRTLRKSGEPSELVVSKALQSELPVFLRGDSKGGAWTKFLLKRMDPNRWGPFSCPPR